MFNFISSLLLCIFRIIFSNRKDLILALMILKKENQIYKRQDRIFLSLISSLSRKAINHLILVKPSTLLNWQRRFIKNYWTYEHQATGRKPVSKEIKDLILEMKTENQLWALVGAFGTCSGKHPRCHRIADELKKIGINLHPTTVNRIIQTFRKIGKIQPNGSWIKF